MKVTIIGAGYVGLVAACCMATHGQKVTCLDLDKGKVELLKLGKLNIYEPNLADLLRRALAAHAITFTSDYNTVATADVVFISVDTPAGPSGECDLSNVFDVAEQIGRRLRFGTLVVLKSTAPVGTCQTIRHLIDKQLLFRKATNVEFDVASNPEFLREGSAVSDFTNPDRVILGVSGERAAEQLKKLYAVFPWTQERILVTDIASSEMIKYASNAMLATRISFMNEMAGLCESHGADIEEVRKGLGTDGRIGPDCLRAGIGFGGSCFPKDLRALRAMAQAKQVPSSLIDAVIRVNDQQIGHFVQKVTEYFTPQGGLLGRTLAIWGLAFKAETDDLRESPALKISRQLIARGAHLRVFDPVITTNNERFAKCEFPKTRVICCQSAELAARGAAGILLLTDWPEFHQVNFQSLAQNMQRSVLFDGRNQLSSRNLGELGFEYLGIGKPEAHLFSKEIFSA